MNDSAGLETQIDEYVSSHGLEHGSALPPIHQLATELACDERALTKAIRAAEKKRKLTFDKSTQVAKLSDYHDRFSFTKSAQSHKHRLTTEVLEAGIRLPAADSEDPFFETERQAQEVLGIRSDKQILVISRLRLLDGRPSVFQRAYLNPARFPNNFVSAHDFKSESLVELYQMCGYTLISRDTTLTARSASLYETNTLLQKFHLEPQRRCVLDAEQKLYAQHPRIKKGRFVLEFLKAAYLDNWKYEIKNRPFA